MQSEERLQAHMDEVIDQVKQLRQQSELGDGRIALYITDTPLVHSMIAEHGDTMRKRVNAVDIVQVDVEAGMPLPKEHPHRTFSLGEDKVTIALEEA